MLMVMLFIPTKRLLKETPLLCLFTPCLQYLLFVDYLIMSLRHGMQMMQVLVVKFHICVCGGTSFHYLDHILAIFLMHLYASKTWLVVKEQYLEHAQLLFANTCVNITTDGRPHLGAAIVSTAFVAQYVSNKITTWISELKLLSSFAITQPHADYSAFTHGLVSKWLFVARTIPNVDDLVHPLEDCIRHSFISAVTGHLPPSD